MNKNYTADELFENWDQSFSAYEMYLHENGKEDFKRSGVCKDFSE